MSISEKLHPRRFPGMSGMMAALVGCVLREAFTKPAFAELVITSDGIVLARDEDDCGANAWIGSVEDWDRNWQTLLEAAGLTPDERQTAEQMREAVTTNWRAK